MRCACMFCSLWLRTAMLPLITGAHATAFVYGAEYRIKIFQINYNVCRAAFPCRPPPWCEDLQGVLSFPKSPSSARSCSLCRNACLFSSRTGKLIFSLVVFVDAYLISFPLFFIASVRAPHRASSPFVLQFSFVRIVPVRRPLRTWPFLSAASRGAPLAPAKNSRLTCIFLSHTRKHTFIYYVNHINHINDMYIIRIYMPCVLHAWSLPFLP